MRTHALSRRARLWVGLALGWVLLLASRRSEADGIVASAVVLRDDRDQLVAIAYPPRDPLVSRRVTIVLHGMCAAPEHECPSYAPAVAGWLLCPRAPAACVGGGHSWSFATTDQVIEKALSKLVQMAPTAVDTRDRTLIGFSLGALAAMRVAHEGHGRYRTVVLIGAKVFPDAQRLADAGVERVALVAGDWDMMRGHMWEQHQRLTRGGFASIFMSLGRIGHAYPPDMTERIHHLLGALGASGGDDPGPSA
jgi:pimeloyl-ACP methyl ester carboxylesterase